MIFYTSPQGSPEWLEERRGVITGSRAKDARDKLKNGDPSTKALLYAMDTAREQEGGKAADVFVNAAMRFGTEQEPIARNAYEVKTGYLVESAGFITTDDRMFGASVDGLVNDDGMVEIKTVVSSDTLFSAVVGADNSAYIDQINFSLWLLGRQWCDLILWAPDLPSHKLTVRRIHRDENAIEKLESDLVAFAKLVAEYRRKLRALLLSPAVGPTDKPQAVVTDLPESIFD